MEPEQLLIRKAQETDLPVLAQFAVALSQLHQGFDAQRFVTDFHDNAGLIAYFCRELENNHSAILLADLAQRPVGYAFIRMEPGSLVDLRRPCAWFHDLYVDAQARGHGVGRRLVEAAIAVARDFGSDGLMLSVAPQNAPARSLFERMGLRATMIEMRMELIDPSTPR
jgi:GNAT superfamily N-acetyltransferase